MMMFWLVIIIEDTDSRIYYFQFFGLLRKISGDDIGYHSTFSNLDGKVTGALNSIQRDGDD